MALPLTVFDTVFQAAPPSPVVVYTAPVGYNSIVLMATVVNTDSYDQAFTLSCVRNSVSTPIVYQYHVPANETLTVLGGGSSGTFVMNTGDQMTINGTSTNLKFSASFLGALK